MDQHHLYHGKNKIHKGYQSQNYPEIYNPKAGKYITYNDTHMIIQRLYAEIPPFDGYNMNLQEYANILHDIYQDLHPRYYQNFLIIAEEKVYGAARDVVLQEGYSNHYEMVNVFEKYFNPTSCTSSSQRENIVPDLFYDGDNMPYAVYRDTVLTHGKDTTLSKDDFFQHIMDHLRGEARDVVETYECIDLEDLLSTLEEFFEISEKGTVIKNENPDVEEWDLFSWAEEDTLSVLELNGDDDSSDYGGDDEDDNSGSCKSFSTLLRNENLENDKRDNQNHLCVSTPYVNSKIKARNRKLTKSKFKFHNARINKTYKKTIININKDLTCRKSKSKTLRKSLSPKCGYKKTKTLKPSKLQDPRIKPKNHTKLSKPVSRKRKSIKIMLRKLWKPYQIKYFSKFKSNQSKTKSFKNNSGLQVLKLMHRTHRVRYKIP